MEGGEIIVPTLHFEPTFHQLQAVEISEFQKRYFYDKKGTFCDHNSDFFYFYLPDTISRGKL